MLVLQHCLCQCHQSVVLKKYSWTGSTRSLTHNMLPQKIGNFIKIKSISSVEKSVTSLKPSNVSNIYIYIYWKSIRTIHGSDKYTRASANKVPAKNYRVKKYYSYFSPSSSSETLTDKAENHRIFLIRKNNCYQIIYFTKKRQWCLPMLL